MDEQNPNEQMKKCPKCGHMNPGDREWCEKCYALFPNFNTQDDNIEDSSNEIEGQLKGSKLAMIFTWLIAGCGFIAGIILGNVFSIKSMHYNEYLEKFVTDDSVFNTVLMLIVWCSAALATLPFILTHYHLKNQETIIKNQDKTNEFLSQLVSTEEENTGENL